LRARFELENKELKQAQTKKSMEDIKAVQQDKGIKTKAERDRRIKELNEKNVKVGKIFGQINNNEMELNIFHKILLKCHSIK
jgi:hypothetical protein